MKVAIYGGTFDPFHSAHKEIVLYLSKAFDRAILVPTNVTYYKNNPTMFSFEERCASLEKELSDLPNVSISRIESNIPSSWRYIDTLNYFSRDLTKTINDDTVEIYTAIGSDSLQKFKTWTSWEDILKLSKLIVFNRPGYEDNFPKDIPYEFVPMNNPESSTRIRASLLKNN